MPGYDNIQRTLCCIIIIIITIIITFYLESTFNNLHILGSLVVGSQFARLVLLGFSV